MRQTGVSERPRALSASTLIGDAVRNRSNEDLGKIEDIMIDLDNGRVDYAVLSFGGFLGMGDKLFAVPWNAMTLDTERHCFILNVDKETLKRAPGFDKDDWPDTHDRGWQQEVYTFYGTKPYWER
jgi:sporulation protein YlmC with PRC-barrel domain